MPKKDRISSWSISYLLLVSLFLVVMTMRDFAELINYITTPRSQDLEVVLSSSSRVFGAVCIIAMVSTLFCIFALQQAIRHYYQLQLEADKLSQRNQQEPSTNEPPVR